MAKLIYSATMSLDGFIAGPGGDMSWMSGLPDDEPEAVRRVFDRTGCILAGNGTYGGDDPNRGTDAEGAFGGMYDGPVVVLTHRPPVDPVQGLEFATDLPSAVARAKELAGEKDVNILGANVAKQCIENGTLDEVLMFVAPVLIGDGVRVFEHAGGRVVRLEQHPEEKATHWYRVVYPA